MNSIQVPRGTSDILPGDIRSWQLVEETARDVLSRYGYQEIRTPLYEETRLFKRSLGQTSEIVNKQLLELATDKDEGYALRPEGTASIVRSYIENRLDKKEPLSKLFYAGPMFRGERPQKGRLRQFHQIGVEAIGTFDEAPLLDAEVIALAVHLLKALGLDGFTLRINSLGTPEDKQGFALWLRDALKDKVRSLSEECQQQFERNVFRLLDSKDPDCRKMVKSLEIAENHLSDSSRAYFAQVRRALDALGIPYEVSPQLVRGLDYYTHTVFEFSHAGLGSQDAVGAGGRYNGLIHQLGGDAKATFGAVGFALGVERILLARGSAAEPVPALTAYVVALDQAQQSRAFEILQSLRLGGIRADMSYAGGSMKSQMRQANKSGAAYVLILGEEEIKADTVAIKNMKEGKQETVPVQDMIRYLQQG